MEMSNEGSVSFSASVSALVHDKVKPDHVKEMMAFHILRHTEFPVPVADCHMTQFIAEGRVVWAVTWDNKHDKPLILCPEELPEHQVKDMLDTAEVNREFVQIPLLHVPRDPSDEGTK